MTFNPAIAWFGLLQFVYLWVVFVMRGSLKMHCPLLMLGVICVDSFGLSLFWACTLSTFGTWFFCWINAAVIIVAVLERADAKQPEHPGPDEEE